MSRCPGYHCLMWCDSSVHDPISCWCKNDDMQHVFCLCPLFAAQGIPQFLHILWQYDLLCISYLHGWILTDSQPDHGVYNQHSVRQLHTGLWQPDLRWSDIGSAKDNTDWLYQCMLWCCWSHTSITADIPFSASSSILFWKKFWEAAYMVYRNKALQRESGKLCYRKSEDTDYGDCNDTDEYWFYYDGSGTSGKNHSWMYLAVPCSVFFWHQNNTGIMATGWLTASVL